MLECQSASVSVLDCYCDSVSVLECQYGTGTHESNLLEYPDRLKWVDCKKLV